MFRRTLVAGFIAAVVLALGGAASAGQYPPGITITANDLTVVPGQTVTFTGSGFQPGSAVAAVVNSVTIDLGSKAADSEGKAAFNFTVPLTGFLGQHTVTMSGTNANGNAATGSLTFTVVASEGDGSLSRTGSDTGTYTRIGVALVAIGGLAVVTARRRRSSSVPVG